MGLDHLANCQMHVQRTVLIRQEGRGVCKARTKLRDDNVCVVV